MSLSILIMKKQLKYIFILTFLTFTCFASSQHNWDSKSWNKNSIGFACCFSGERTKPVEEFTQLLLKGNYKKMRTLLYSDIPAYQFISVFTIENLAQKRDVFLTIKETHRISEIKESEKLVPICSGCTYFTEFPLNVLFDKIIEHKHFIGAENWFEYYYSNRKIPKSKIKADIHSPKDTMVYEAFEVDESPVLIANNKKYKITEIKDFINHQLLYPVNGNECTGKVYISFIVEKDGTISHQKYERKLCEGFDQEAMRVINLMDRWKPGLKNGKIVRCKLVVPVNWRMY